MIDLKNIPANPGCYLYKDISNNVIYVGKAKNLKNRVKSYFAKNIDSPKTKVLVSRINSVEFFVTSNEIEALILENNLIKKHMPKYNINLKDSKSYAYILVTDETFPRILTARNRDMKGKYFGPYASGDVRNEVIKILNNSFMLRTCRLLPKKVCLRYHLNLCTAPCIGNITEGEYSDTIRKAESFLNGKTKELQDELKSEMKVASSKLNFEKAKILRDQISSISYLDEKQKFENVRDYDQDIINYVVDFATKKIYLMVFKVTSGIISAKSEYVFENLDNLHLEERILEEFLVQYYSETVVPKEIILPQKLKDDSILEFLEAKRKNKVIITIPKQGSKLELIELVKKNIEITFLKENAGVTALRTELNLNQTPNVIECFDISHISGTNTVASMVQYRGGVPDKSNYRRFKIKTVSGVDDFASIKEVVSRRYFGLKENATRADVVDATFVNAADVALAGNVSGASGFPDLIVIDGGAGQLGAAISALNELELKIPIISLAKKFEEIYVPAVDYSTEYKVIRLDPRKSLGLKLLMQIRDETHRFAIKYHRLLRSKKFLSDD